MKNGGFMKNGATLLTALLFAGVILIGIAAADADKQYESSQKCKICHEQIYDEWNESMHAKALTDPIFQGALAQMEDTTMCISCHAPTTRYTGDFGLTKDISKEAITCDFCHTISGLDASNPIQPFLLNPGETKYGPYADAETAAHKTQYLELLTKSEFCAACHQIVFPNGLEVLGTYTEWNNSDYAREGIQCQECHMQSMERSIAAGAEERDDSTRHEWRGGHSADMVREAGELELEVDAEGNEVDVKATITNENAGHKFPTGDLSQLVLKISATDKNGKKLFDDTKIFSKVYGDADGNIVIGPDLATQILSDNRILPNAKSTNEFKFKVPNYKGRVTVTATLLYRLAPEEAVPEEFAPPVTISEITKAVKLKGEKKD